MLPYLKHRRKGWTLMKKLSRKLTPYWFALPAVAFVVMFTYYPFFRTVYNSLFAINSYGVTVRYLGFRNYLDVLNNKHFVNALLNSLKYSLIGVPSSILVSLLLALLSNRRRLFSKAYEVMFSLPMAISMSATCMIFKLLLNPTVGYLNYALSLNVQWLNSRQTALFSLILVSGWMSIGFQYIFLMAALRGVPQELTEASQIEGANAMQRTVYVTLPLISPTLFYLVCTDIVTYMMMAGPSLVLTDGGPFRSTETLIYHMYDRSIYNQFWGYGYAMSVIIFLLLLVMILLTFRVEKKGVYYT